MQKTKVLSNLTTSVSKGLKIKTVGYCIGYETVHDLKHQLEVQDIFNYFQTKGPIVAFKHLRSKSSMIPKKIGKVTFKYEKDAIDMLAKYNDKVYDTDINLRFYSLEPKKDVEGKNYYKPKVFSLVEENKELKDFIKELVKYSSLQASDINQKVDEALLINSTIDLPFKEDEDLDIDIDL